MFSSNSATFVNFLDITREMLNYIKLLFLTVVTEIDCDIVSQLGEIIGIRN